MRVSAVSLFDRPVTNKPKTEFSRSVREPKEIWIDGKTKFVLDNLYLVGHCYLRDEKRTFRVDRIKGLKISK